MILKTTALAVATFAASTAAAQSFQLGLTGRVVEIVDERGIFDDVALGQLVDGSIAIAGDASGLLDGVSIPGFDFNLVDVQSFEISTEGFDLAGLEPQATIFNDLPFPGSQPGDEPGDSIFFDAIIIQPDNTSGNITANLVGNTGLFQSADIGAAPSITLEELEVAEVTIEFSIATGIPGTPDFNVIESRVTIELLTLTSNGGAFIAPVCLPDTNENDEVDFGDFNAWILRYNQRDYRADINLDGDVTPADFNAWIQAYNRGC